MTRELETTLRTLGAIDEWDLTGDRLILQGWCLSLDGTPVQTLDLVAGGAGIDATVEMGLPSPHVPAAHPFPGADRCGFRLDASVPVEPAPLLLIKPSTAKGAGATLVLHAAPSLPIPPPDLVAAIGGGFEEVSHQMLTHLVDRAGLRPTDTVLDLGCGVGRLAYSLADYLQSPGTYRGLDASAALVAWPIRHYQPLSPLLTFQHLDVRSGTYNPTGTVPSVAAQLPFPNETFDVVAAFSLFTHLLPATAAHYLREGTRALAPGGRMAVTWFLLNEESLDQIARGGSSQALRHRYPPNCLVADLDEPEGAIGYVEADVLAMAAAAGLDIVATHRGSWSGARPFLGDHQDMTVLQRPPRS
jgi:SAM-dependent methyltransferase